MKLLNVTSLLRRRRSKRNSGSLTRQGRAREQRETSRALRAPFISLTLPPKAFLESSKVTIVLRLLVDVAPCNGIQDNLGFWIPRRGFRIPDSRYWIVDSLSVELGFRIQIVSGIPDSLSCILDFKAQDSRFQKWPVCRPTVSDVWKAPLVNSIYQSKIRTSFAAFDSGCGWLY